MPQAAAAVVANPLMQLVSQCGEQPVVFDDVLPDLCPALEHVILERMSDRRKTASLNVGGWKSGEDFFTWPDEAVQELRTAISELTGVPSPVAWAMVNRGGSQHPRHQHLIARLTGVFYVSPGTPGALVPTIFECPCDGRPVRRGDRYTVHVDPHPGRLVVCRGQTWHRVPAYHGELPRITVAFDARR